MDSDLRSKALGYLRAGAVKVCEVRDVGWPGQPGHYRIVMATVQGHAQVHAVDGTMPTDGDEAWTCLPCKLAQPCAHIAAVQLVTGGKTGARQVAQGVRRVQS